MLEVGDLGVLREDQGRKGITFDVDEGEIVTLIGANGAGESRP